MAEAALEPDPHLNILVGANGQGKTSIIEAIGYLATLRSFRGAKSDEVIRYGESRAEIRCIASGADESQDAELKSELEVVFQSQGDALGGKVSKTAAINGKPYKSSTQYLSQRFGSFQVGFHAIVFNPSDHDLVRGEPAIRRGYLDRVISAEDLDYLKALQKYKRAVEQRNALLKTGSPARSLLEGFTDPVIEHGALLAYKRLQWLQALDGRLNESVRQIAPRQPVLRVFSASSWVPKIASLSIDNRELDTSHFTGQYEVPSLELLKQALRSRLSELERAEQQAGITLAGPHRDDWLFFLGSQSLKGHGSQGEVRSALLALKISEIELFRKRTGHRPLFLLDDFSSELDRERRTFLLEFLSKTDLQVFITTTEDSSSVGGKRFVVVNGNLSNA